MPATAQRVVGQASLTTRISVDGQTSMLPGNSRSVIGPNEIVRAGVPRCRE